jgi:rod shape-determining protein MreC
MRHLISTKVKVILILAVLLAAGLTIFSGVSNQNIFSNVTQSVLTPLRSGVNSMAEQAEKYYGYMFAYESLVAENAELKSQLAQMQNEARLADSVERENQRLRALLALNTVHEDYKEVDAYIISRSSTDWTSTFTVNRGSDSGIAVDMCAITENGEVIGLVTEVGSNYAVIKTVLDSTLEISAIISESGYNGMVSGGYAQGMGHFLQMDYLPSSAIIKNKDQVVTSGSTVYPRGLILGHVVDADFDDTGVAKYAILRPAADFDVLEQVFILTEYTTNAE